MKYIQIPEETFKAFNISKEHTLDYKEIIELLAHKDVLEKFIEQKAISIQFDIWDGKYRWKEDLYFWIIEELAKIAVEIWDIKSVFYNHKDFQEEQERQEKEDIENKN